MKLFPLLTLLAALTAPLAHSGEITSATVNCTIGQGRDALKMPCLSIPLNKGGSVRAAKDSHYPIEWDLPEKREQIIIPHTPHAFDTTYPGWTLNYSVKQEGTVILLSGTAEFTEVTPVNGVYGEQSGPIYHEGKPRFLITENVTRTMAVSKTITPFQINALPGQEYEIRIKRLNKWISCRISCEVISAPKK